ncbi:hypothetical protein UCRPC4_g00810 [Phaeomoniella chlamydospora]|uniref:T6SS Phospholipase effector Tle1-like catalytic domain-containing protein n=1 Tax=Phaeomoniella chlamydospora TaxID=158046 RepID=A0A0G2HHS5_PHACM|nr:hypothetical protein UCRPC4_g00810 [Phaeomoniella chlamydospora]
MSSPSPEPYDPNGPGKRLIVCCDGTWKDSDGKPDWPSNVTRIARCIKTVGYDKIGKKEIPQITYYQSGVGVEQGWFSSVIGGATGKGIGENIREAYRFICNNYNHGDEIFLVGFSRGAFTARSISTLMSCIGLLTPKGMVHFYQIFKDWENQDSNSWTSPYKPWPGRPAGGLMNTPETRAEYQRALQSQELSRFDCAIKACGVFDTVGSLGIPAIGILPRLFRQHLTFVDTKVESNIEHAFQALALDERRRPFSPTIWEKPEGQENPKVLKQCWFPGVHSDIGGGYPHSELANITLVWMISNLEQFIDFDKSYILQQQRLTREHIEDRGHKPRDWGLIHNSFTPQFWLTGSAVRTPANYFELENSPFSSLFGLTGRYRSNRRRLHNTRQTVHASVRVRKACDGRGYNDKGYYECAALKGWKWKPVGHFAEVHTDGENGNSTTPRKIEVKDIQNTPSNTVLIPQGKVIWYKPLTPHERSRSFDQNPEISMEEDDLGDLELLLMENWSQGIVDHLEDMIPELPPHVLGQKPEIGHWGALPTMRKRGKSKTYPKDRPEEEDILRERAAMLGENEHVGIGITRMNGIRDRLEEDHNNENENNDRTTSDTKPNSESAAKPTKRTSVIGIVRDFAKKGGTAGGNEISSSGIVDIGGDLIQGMKQRAMTSPEIY